MKKVIFGLIATLLFVSCENETTNSESNYSKSNTLEQNLNEFSKNHIARAKDLVSLIRPESTNLLFDENSFNEIMELETENDVEIYFKSKGLSDTKKFISILKELETNYKSFIENTPSFNSLNNEEKFNLIENSLNIEMDKDAFWSVQNVNLNARISCSEQAAIDRAGAYIEAGADMLFPEAITELDMYKQFAQKTGAPILANITEFGSTPLFTTEELASADVSLALYPLSAFRAMNKAAETVYETLRKEGTQKNVIDIMQTRKELYERINYYAFEDYLDNAFAKKK